MLIFCTFLFLLIIVYLFFICYTLHQLQYCVINKDGAIKLKKEHPYFYQIIGQLRITGRNICFFVVHTKNWTHIEKINYDGGFWETKMVNKLKM